MKELPFAKAEAPSLDLLSIGAQAQLLKARISGYTRKDGTYVKEHDDSRAAARPKAPAAPARSNAPPDGDGSKPPDSNSVVIPRQRFKTYIGRKSGAKTAILTGESKYGEKQISHDDSGNFRVSNGLFGPSSVHESLDDAVHTAKAGGARFADKHVQQMRDYVAGLSGGSSKLFPATTMGRKDALFECQDKEDAIRGDGFKVASRQGGSGGKSEERRWGMRDSDDHHIINFEHQDGRKKTLSWRSGPSGHSVTVDDVPGGGSKPPVGNPLSKAIPLLFVARA